MVEIMALQADVFVFAFNERESIWIIQRAKSILVNKRYIMKVKVAQSCPTLGNTMDFSGPEYWSGQPFHSPGDLPKPGMKPRSPTLQADSLPAEPQEKIKNTGVGSLSLLQGVFPTQEPNWGLLLCRHILYQVS